MKYLKRLWFTLALPIMFLYGSIIEFLRNTTDLRNAWVETWIGEADDLMWRFWLDPKVNGDDFDG